MTDLLMLFAGLGMLAAILANIALRSPRRLWLKLAALATVAIFLPTGYFGLSDMLGRPKPVKIEWSQANLAQATVIGSWMDEGKAIYLWLGIEGLEEPRAYALPWSEEMARQLHGAQRVSEQNGTQIQMRLPFEMSMDSREQRFYAKPPPPPPEKQPPSENPLLYQRSDGSGSSSAD